MDDLISIATAAQLLECTPESIYMLIKRGKITATGPRRKMQVSRTQVLAWKNRGANLQEIIDHPEKYQIAPSVDERLRLVELLNQTDKAYEEQIIERLEQRRQREIERYERLMFA